MRRDVAHRAFKDGLYDQLARVGKAIANPHRLEILELLAQGPRTVESVAGETALSIANASQHLRALHAAGLLTSRKDGLFVHYALADNRVSDLSRVVRDVAERRLAEIDRLVRDHFVDRAEMEAVGMKELLARMRDPGVVVLDTRPASEFAAGHIAGAVSAPVDELASRLRALPKRKEYVAYCRGPYCIYADRAVEMLKKRGARACRLSEGFPEWKAAGLPVEVSEQGEGGAR
jgi:rhodanese-related sulfurtransferase/DNA-binding transcriptional ArsR family regulator